MRMLFERNEPESGKCLIESIHRGIFKVCRVPFQGVTCVSRNLLILGQAERARGVLWTGLDVLMRVPCEGSYDSQQYENGGFVVPASFIFHILESR